MKPFRYLTLVQNQLRCFGRNSNLPLPTLHAPTLHAPTLHAPPPAIRHLLALALAAGLVLGAPAETNKTFRCQAKVVDAKGQPVPGATVELYQGTTRGAGGLNLQTVQRSTTDGTGTAALAATNQTWFTVVATKPGLALNWCVWNSLTDPDRDSLELALTAPVSLSGSVQDAAHKPVADALVWVDFAYHPAQSGDSARSPLTSRLGREYLSARTAADGKFRLEGLPPDTKLELGVSKPGLALDRPPRSTPYLDLASLPFEAGQSNVELTLKPAGAIEGRVVREDTGAPVAGARVALAYTSFDNDSPFSALTGPEGAFRLNDLSAGDYRLHALVGTNPFPDLICETVTATVESGATNRAVKLIASPGAVLEVSVRDDTGNRPIPNALVRVVRPSATRHSATTFEHGLARFRLSPGDYQILVSKEGSSVQPTQATLERNQTNAVAIAMATVPAAKVAGAVLEADGKPAPNVSVTSFPLGGAEKQTDAQGRFTLPLNSNRMGPQNLQPVLIARDFTRNLAAAADLEEDATNLTLRLEPALTLAGRITDANNQPITNAEAELIFQTERMGTTLGRPVRADAQGRFEIKALPPGRRYGVNASAKGFGVATRNLAAEETSAGRHELDPFRLPLAELRLAGVVVDSDDQPAAGVVVLSYGENQPRLQGRTDAKGRFAFDHVCAGPINLSANSPSGGGYGSVTAQGGDTNITIQLGVQENVRFPAAGNSRPKISGSVVDPDGKPAPRLTVSLFPFSSYAQKRTDVQGRFTITAESTPGGLGSAQRVLLVRDPARNLAAALDLEEDATNATLRLAPGLSLAGRVTDSNGQPVSNAQAQLFFRIDRTSAALDRPVRADADGRFDIKALPPGRRYSVTVSAKGFGQDSHDIDAPETGNQRVEPDPFQLPIADQRIAGFVFDADDKPVAGAWLYTYGNQQPNLQGQTDAKGHFTFDKLCAGAVNVSANSPRGGFGAASVEAGDTNVSIRLGSSPSLRAEAPRPPTLKGKPLPDLTPLGLTPADAPAGQPVLALLLDAEQRPSRRALRSLADQAASLKQKGLAIIILQTGALADDAFAAWKQEAAVPFPVGRAQDDPDKTRTAWGAAALPWFILTDKSHRVAAEGFALEELDSQLSQLKVLDKQP